MSKQTPHRYIITLDDDVLVSRVIEQAIGLPSVTYSTSEALLQDLERDTPTAVFIDIHLGIDSNGLGVLPTLRGRWPFTPLIVITGDTTDEALSGALALGADDFIRKPIRPVEIIARLQSRLGDLAEKQAKSTLRSGDVALHTTKRSLTGKKGKVYLSPTAVTLLTMLIQSKGTVVKRQQLKQKAWGNFLVTDNALDRKLHEVRKALEETSETVRLKNIYGVGFSLGPIENEEGKDLKNAG